jgi:LysR family glycine cleavage system transcriptional activator
MTLPSLSALVALETLARTGSVTRTAAEMALTHSAVSHKLKGLERRLGFALTVPEGRGVALTPRARAYVAEIRPALEALTRAARPGPAAEGRLTVNVAPGFAAAWLCPRLGAFRALHPEVALRLNSPRGYGDLGRGEDDLYITFARAGDLPAAARRLMDVAFFPVCAPALLHRGGGLARASDLGRETLLHLDGREDWTRWLRAAGAGDAAARGGGILFQDLQVMLAAALAGQGVALGDTLSTATHLESGRLARPFGYEVPAGRCYWLVPGRGGDSPQAAAFAGWLTAALGGQSRPISATGAAGSRE